MLKVNKLCNINWKLHFYSKLSTEGFLNNWLIVFYKALEFLKGLLERDPE